MRTSYYLITAAGLAAAVTVYAKLSARDVPREVPLQPMPADSLAAPAPLPALPAVPDVPLPPIVMPPDTPLAIPAAGSQPIPAIPAPITPIPMTPPAPAVPGAAQPAPPPMIPAVPAASNPSNARLPVIPATPAIPAAGSTQPPAIPDIPAIPTIPPVAPPPGAPSGSPPIAETPAPVKPLVAPPVRSTDPPAASKPLFPAPAAPVVPETPPVKPLVAPPARTSDSPVMPIVPTTPAPQVAPPPAAIAPVVPKSPQEPKPFPLPEPTPFTPGLDSLKPEPAANLASAGKFIIVKGNKLIEGAVKMDGDKVTVRQGALDRTFAKADVLYVAETKDDVYKFMLARVPAADAGQRLVVAKWCMFSGLREQALAEAREIGKLQPGHKAAADMVASLERSLKEYPPDGSAPKTAGALVTVVEPEPDVTAEGATTFATRAQPILANQCMECHARGDHVSGFKLIRVTGFEVGPQSTHANLRAAAAQLKKDDPANSPLLVKSLVAHGGMKQPAFVSRQAVAFRALESWVTLAAATASVPPMTPPTQPLIAPTPPVTPIPPATASTAPLPSPAVPAAAQQAPVLPPVEPMPTTVPPVLPTPSSIPPVDSGMRPTTPTGLPAIPTIPPAASVPKPSDAVKPASGTGSQFGTGTKPNVPTGPANDEFDPAGFNRNAQPPK